jgi:hypothetical protein
MKNKKASLALTAIVFFAVVGGAMAFKASKTKRIWYAPNAGDACNVAYQGFTLDPGGTGAQTHASIASTTTTCPVVTVKADD